MSANLYVNLSWLPRRPENFNELCRTALDSQGELGMRIRTLAGYGLDENALNRVFKVIVKTRDAGLSLAPLLPFRLGVISNANSHFLAPALTATAARHGIDLECIEADYGQILQEALDPDSTINRARPDAVLIAIDYRGLPLRFTPGDEKAHAETVGQCLQHIAAIRNGLHENGGAFCIVQTLARPVKSLTGSFELALPGTMRSLINAINIGLAESLAGTTDILLDVADLAETVGLAQWHDPTFWNLAKLPFSSLYLPLYAEHICRIIAAQRGKSRRCLILDLDNTVWGGIIGDDGLEGIVIGQGDATGEAHLDVQQTALGLRERGIVLAVSSKNTDEIARKPFREHPDMLLREEHLAVFQANWNDKATNITAIAKELSLGLDAMAFLDDNPVERNLVRQMLPMVAVPELPADPALYTRYLLAAGLFEAVAFSAEDGRRAEFYQDNARRVALQQQVGDLDAYLVSLDMHISFQAFDDTGRTRITQLINKSNQFNLTTRRYSEEEVRETQNSADCFTLQVRLSDVFGDNGMISVIICRQADEDWEIDTWLMSCRVLGRKVEMAVLQEILLHARSRGVRRLLGCYRPTERNQLVADHYAKLGFEAGAVDADGASHWLLDVATTPEQPVPMKITRL
ncbi:MAG: HAD-IIIC family phosphatase [Methylococcales bacterium]|nr:HAD-IIIC family phosphatase [Methylococcales bacterium]